MPGRTRKVAASLSCLCLALSVSLGAAVDGHSPRKLRGESTKKTEPERRRRLMKKKAKSYERREPGSQRMIVRCKAQMSDENCLEQLTITGENLNVVHRLSSLHSFAIEGDLSTFEDLRRMGIELLPDYERKPLVLEDSIQYHRALADQSIPYGVDLINAPEVWQRYGVDGTGVKICVLDTGVDPSHPDFADSDISGYTGPEFVSRWDDDRRGHGTHITGIIAASNNNEGVVGVAPGAEIFMVHVFRNNGRVFSSDILAATEVCRLNGANIINMSLGGSGYEETEQAAFNRLYEDGILTVASSGNSGGPDTIYPAAYDKVISVAASDQNDSLARFSTLNGLTNIAAPGVAIRSTFKNGNYVSFSGTSMAAPHVSGVLALLLNFRSSLSPEELTIAIIESARAHGDPAYSTIGIVDALSAIQLIESGLPSNLSQPQCVPTELLLETDEYGSETYYRLQRVSDEAVIWYGGGLESGDEYREAACLDPSECYQFDIRDTYGDGISGPGLRLSYGRRVEYSGGNFGRGFYSRLGDCP